MKRPFALLVMLALPLAGAHESGIHKTGKVQAGRPYALHWLLDGRLLLAHDQGVQVTGDHGKTWQTLTGKRDFNALTLHHAGKTIIASGKNLYATSTNGTNWTSKTLQGVKGRDLRAYAVHLKNTRVHYTWEANGGLYASRDNGKSWRSVRAAKLPQDVRSLAVDHQANLYAATGRNGVWFSSNRGKNFKPLDTPDQRLHTLAVASDGNLWAAGKSGLWRNNRGLWVYMDGKSTVAFAVDPQRPSEAVWIDDHGTIYRNEDMFARQQHQHP